MQGWFRAAQPGEKGADKKTPDKGGNRASKTQKRIEGVYLFDRIKLNTLLNSPECRLRVTTQAFERERVALVSSTQWNDRAVDQLDALADAERRTLILVYRAQGAIFHAHNNDKAEGTRSVIVDLIGTASYAERGGKLALVAACLLRFDGIHHTAVRTGRFARGKPCTGAEIYRLTMHRGFPGPTGQPLVGKAGNHPVQTGIRYRNCAAECGEGIEARSRDREMTRYCRNSDAAERHNRRCSGDRQEG